MIRLHDVDFFFIIQFWNNTAKLMKSVQVKGTILAWWSECLNNCFTRSTITSQKWLGSSGFGIVFVFNVFNLNTQQKYIFKTYIFYITAEWSIDYELWVFPCRIFYSNSVRVCQATINSFGRWGKTITTTSHFIGYACWFIQIPNGKFEFLK